MTEPNTLLLKTNLKHLRLPTMNAEFAALAREAATANENYEQYLLRLTEVEVAARAANVLKARIKQAHFPAAKDFDSYDFTAQPSVNKLKILELASGTWIEDRFTLGPLNQRAHPSRGRSCVRPFPMPKCARIQRGEQLSCHSCGLPAPEATCP